MAPDGRPRPDAPFGRGPLAARVLAHVTNAASVVGSRLPTRLAAALAVLGGHAEWAARRRKRARLAVNLAHAVSAAPGSRRVRRLVRQEFVSEARRSADLLWAMRRPRDFLDNAELVGLEHAKAALSGGRGAVIAGIHLGGWEVAAAVPGAVLDAPTTVLVADDWLAWSIQRIRSAAGLHVVYRGSPALAAVRVLQRGEALLLLGDDASGAQPRRYTVRFCDAHAQLPAGIVALARLSSAPIVPFSVVPLAQRHWQVKIEPPIDPPPRAGGSEGERAVLQELAEQWTAMLREHPEHWAASFEIRWTTSP